MKRLHTLSALALLSALGACATAPPPSALAQLDARTPTAEVYGATLAGRYADLTGQPAEAARYYARAHAARPEDGEVLSRAVDASLAAGDVPKAAALTRTVPPSLRSTPAVLALAVDEVARGRRAEALAAARSRPFGPLGSWLSRSIEAWVLADEGKAAEALARLEEPPGLTILDQIALFQRGALLERLGRLDEAEATYAEAWAGGGRFAQGLDAYGRLLERRGRGKEALELYTAFLKDVGDNPMIEALAQRIERGETLPNTRRTAGQGAAMAFFGGAAAIGSQAELEAAIPWLHMTLRLDPDHDPARMMLASALSRVGRDIEAASHWRAIPVASAYYASAQTELAWALLRDGKEAEALTLAEATVETTNAPRARSALADMYRASSKYQQASELYTAIINETPEADRNWRVYFARGAMMERLKRFEESDADFQRALLLSPDEPEVLNYLAYSWVERGINIDRALSMLETAVAKRPNAGFIVDSLGWALFKLGRYNQAVARLEEAAALDPGDPEINDHLGDAYWRVGRKAEAAFQWNRVLSLKPSDEITARVQAKISNGLADSGEVQRAERATP